MTWLKKFWDWITGNTESKSQEFSLPPEIRSQMQGLIVKLEALMKKRRKRLAKQSAEPKYRLLQVGEVVQEGDEVRGGEEWFPVTASIGYKVPPDYPSTFRRRIEEDKQ